MTQDRASITHTQLFFSILFVLGVGCPMLVKSQNLVPNWSFEVYTMCPTGLGAGGPMECVPWFSPYVGTADYFNVCANPMYTGVPTNFQGFQYAHTGVAYTGLYAKVIGYQYREYIFAELLEPLEEDTCYKISFWINAADQGCGTNHIGAYLSEYAPSNPVGLNPQINWSGQFFSDSVNWKHIYGYYTALGGEEFITLGNFAVDAETDWDPACEAYASLSYYYIDDVSIESMPSEVFDLELDGPINTCDTYTIDPGITEDVVYLWSTGSEEPTLTVYTSGTYTLTVYYGCTETEDEIEVNILGSNQVDLGPDFILCEGDTYTIELDPDAGDYEWQDGSNDPEYTITAPGFYAVTLNDGCAFNQDELVVTGLDIPLPFSLGPDAFLCPGDQIIYQFNPLLGDFLWQDDSTDPTYEIDNEGSYSLTISNICGEQTDEVDIIEIDLPEFSLGPDSAVLCNDDFIEYDFDPDMGNFIWQDGSNDPDYTISGPGNYFLTVTNVCGMLSDAISVTQMDEPYIDFGPAIQLCEGETAFLDASTNSGTFEWQDGSTSPIYIVTTSGTYSLTVTNACGEDSDEISIFFNEPVTPPNLGPDVTLCPGQQITLDANSPNAQYIWNDLSTGPSLLVQSAGTYYVEVYNFCGSYTDTIEVTFNNTPPDLNLPADFQLCQGQSAILEAGISGATYLWNDGSNLPQLSVSAPGLYSLTVTTACGTDNDEVMILDGGPAPTVSLGADTSLCPGSTFTLIPNFSNVNSWVWPDSSSDSFFNITSPGLIYVDVANSCGVSNDSILITSLPPTPSLSLGADSVICPGQSITLSVNIPNVQILWSDGSTDPDFTVIDNVTVWATVSDICGSSSDSMNVSLLPDAPSLNLGQDQTICPGEVVVIDPDIPNVTYIWQDGSINPEIQVTQGTLVILTVANACGMATDSLLITESTNGPQIDLGPDLSVCVGDIVTIPAGIGGVNYLWQDGSTGDEFITSVSGTFILAVDNLCGSDTDTIEVDISGLPPIVNLGQDTSFCNGGSVLLSSNGQGLTSLVWQDGSAASTFLATMPGVYWLMESNTCGNDVDSLVISLLNAPSPFDLGPDTTLCNGSTLLLTSPLENMISYAWQDGSSNPVFLINSPGTYSLTGTNVCGEVTDNVVVTYLNAPGAFDLGPDTIICPGASFILSAPSTSYDLLWQDGSQSPSILVEEANTYSLQISNSCGVATDNLNVGFDLNQPVLNLPTPLPWCEGDAFTLDASQSFNTSYVWSTGETSSSITVTIPGTYAVDVIAQCAVASQEVEVVIMPGCAVDVEISIPNVFSPNGDQVNDEFSVSFGPAIEVIVMKGTIFDRWGNMVFHSTLIPFTWNGHFNNEELMPGVFVYLIEVQYNVQGTAFEEKFYGDVTLVR